MNNKKVYLLLNCIIALCVFMGCSTKKKDEEIHKKTINNEVMLSESMPNFLGNASDFKSNIDKYDYQGVVEAKYLIEESEFGSSHDDILTLRIFPTGEISDITHVLKIGMSFIDANDFKKYELIESWKITAEDNDNETYVAEYKRNNDDQTLLYSFSLILYKEDGIFRTIYLGGVPNTLFPSTDKLNGHHREKWNVEY